MSAAPEPLTTAAGRLLTVDQVADQVQLCSEAVRRAIRRGDLNASRLGGRLRVRPVDVERWLDTCALAVTALPKDMPDSLPRSKPGSSVRDRMRHHRDQAA